MPSQRAPETGHFAGDFSIGQAACPNEARRERRADHCPSHLAAQPFGYLGANEVNSAEIQGFKV
jgi:hypothetical protein